MTQKLIKINGIYDISVDDCTAYNILANFNIFYEPLGDICTIKYTLNIINEDKFEHLYNSLDVELVYDLKYILDVFSPEDIYKNKDILNILFYKILNIICDKEDIDWGYFTFERIYGY